jgi:gamma-glutamylputrescine oxidase
MNLLHANDRTGEYPASWYAATATPPAPFPELTGETRADVCVVGGGFTGLSCALHLAQAGVGVMLIEAHRVGFGASGRNGGQVGSGQRKDQHALERAYGLDMARRLWQVAADAKALVRSLIANHDIAAGWKGGVAHAAWRAADAHEERAYVEHLNRTYDYPHAKALDREGLRALVGSDAFCGGSVDWGAGHIHPLRFALGLARAAAQAGVRIFEMSEVTAVDTGTVRTAKGHVTADHVVLACNGYLGSLQPKVAARVMPINNFIVATEPLGDRAATVLARDIAVADSKFVVNYWRLSEDRRLLFGGTETYGYRFPRDIAGAVRKPMLKIYPQLADARIDYAWGGTLAITPTRMPDFARPAPGLWSASGYSGHGVALATMAGKLIADAIRGDSAGFDLMAATRPPAFPGLGRLRSPLLALAMTWYAMRDRLGR